MQRIAIFILTGWLVAVAAEAQSRRPPIDTTVVTRHTVTVKGQRIPYRAEAGMQPVWDEWGRPIATMFYVYYEREDVQDRARRPLIFSFNGV